MLALKYLSLIGGIGLMVAAVAMLALDLWRGLERQRRRQTPSEGGQAAPEPEPLQLSWRPAVLLALLAWLPLLLSIAIVVIPSGEGGVRVSQLSGTLPGTLYPGAHLVRPFIDNVVTYNIRDQVLSTAGAAPQLTATTAKREEPRAEPMTVQSKEGLPIGLAVTVRYRLDPQRLDHIHSSLPQPVEKELVPPVVASAFRELAPKYTVREMFATKREEVRQLASEAITRKLAADGIEVREVMLRDIQLPPEYARGLEILLLKEQEADRMVVETEIKQKQVRISELQAEAAKVQQVKQAEAQAQVRVLEAKGEADSMKYLLPLKQKQIEQTRLEAEARKESTIKGAEAAAAAKVIDSKAELQRRNLLADAEANRIRVTAVADAERMRQEAAVLSKNPLLINKIMAERLSDKIQVMMVPTDGKFFFNDLFKGIGPAGAAAQDGDPQDPPRQQAKGGYR